MADSCAVCKFAMGMPDGGMFCRRNPPTLIVSPQGQPMGVFPPVAGDFWCGCFEKASVVVPTGMAMDAAVRKVVN